MFSTRPPSPTDTQPPPREKLKTFRISKTPTAIDTPMILKPFESIQELSPPCSIPKSSSDIMTSTSASTTSSSENANEKNKNKKFLDYFEKMMKEVLEKQEKMQKTFVETLEKCEKDRIEREEAWKTQELARLEREKEMLAKERAILAARDAAMVTILQKISNKGIQIPEILLNPRPITQIPVSTPISNPSQPRKIVVKRENNIIKSPNQESSSRWPKIEIEALIRLRTELDIQYQESGPKGPLWEEVSISMEKIGYNRSARRCKEKWENINKYYRRMKECNKRRPEDSKTCPYFNLLESIYEKKQKRTDDFGCELKAEDILMQMQQEQRRLEYLEREEFESEKVGQNQDDYGNDEYEENGIGCEIVANN